jgi:lipopolysaccharide heptosyltransferase II
VAPNLLIVRFSSIGDLLLTTPLLRALRARHPGCRITFVLREDMADTLRHNPRIDRLVTWRSGTPLSPLIRELRGEPWTHRLDLQRSLRSWRLRMGIGGRWLASDKQRVNRAVLIASRRRRGTPMGPVAERYFAAAADLDVSPDGGPAEFFTSAEADRQAAAFLSSAGLGLSRRLVALAPGAAHHTKRWPEEHWRELIERLAPTCDIVILGGPTDRDLGERLARAGGSPVGNATGRFSLLGSGALLKRADVAVAGDTGLLHLATAVGTPVVGLYGPGVPEFGFYPYRAAARVLEQDLRCRPCSAHGSERCPLGHHRCLRDTRPADVMSALGGPIR